VGTTKLIESEHGGVERIGRYELIAEIASGGMATVYLARLSGVGGFQRNVAVKCLHPHLAKNSEFVEMFLDEARLAASIHHPNVVPIQEVGEGAGGYYLVMDYVEGDTFATLLSRAAMEGKEVPRDISLRVVVDMLAGLHAAHELRDDHGSLVGLVHRDVSPQNILVGTDGVTRITDFGVARAASRLSATRAGQLKGKLAYMAPEQAHGEEAVDRRADVFSAGVVLWEAMALRRLFKASNEAATLSRVLNDEIVSPREFSEDVPESVAQVCLKALDRDLERRYVSCAEFADALEKAAAAANCLATGREVAAYVNEVVGESLESHRQAIREWLDKRGREPSSPSSPSISSIQAPAITPPPPPPSRRASEQSAITKAGGVARSSLRPPPPTTGGVMSARLASQPSAAPAPSGVVPRAHPPVPSAISIPVDAPGTMVSALPTRKRDRRPLIIGGVAAVLGIVLIAVLLSGGDDETTPQPLVTPAPVPTQTAPAATTTEGSSEATATQEVIDAEELPKAEDDGTESAAGEAETETAEEETEANVRKAKPAPRPAVRWRRPVKKKKKPVVDLENPYR
jgi:serine/threonine-protein kinase